MSSIVADGGCNFLNVASTSKRWSSHTLCCRFSSRNLEINLYSKAVMHSADVRLALLTLKYRVVSFRTQYKIVLLSAAPPVRLTTPFSPLELALTSFNRMQSLRK